MRFALIGALFATALAAACTQAPTPATQETLLTASATVESVNRSTREVRLRDNSGGGVFSVQAGPEVRNFDQLERGDQVTVDYYQAMTVAMANASDVSGDTAVLAGRAPEGARPGGLALITTDVVVEFQSYDPDTGVATFVAPDGSVRQTLVEPNLRDFAAQRQRGDRILVTITEGMAVTITES